MSGRVEVLSTSSSDDEVQAPPREADTQEPVGGAVDLEACNTLKLQGNALFSAGKVPEALAVYRKALLVAPIKPMPKPSTHSHDPLEARRAAESTSSNKADTATEDAADAKKEEAPPDDTDYTTTSQVFCNAGFCLSKLEVKEEALSMYSEAIRHNPAYQRAYLRRADCYYSMAKWANAMGDYEQFEKLGGALDGQSLSRKAESKQKVDAEMSKMLGDLKDLGNRFLGNFGLSTDNFKFDKDPQTGGYSMRFEQ